MDSNGPSLEKAPCGITSIRIGRELLKGSVLSKTEKNAGLKAQVSPCGWDNLSALAATRCARSPDISKKVSYKKSGVATIEVHKKKHCEVCAKPHPWSSGTHNTIQFFKWNVDETGKDRHTDYGRGNIREKAKRFSNAIKKS